MVTIKILHNNCLKKITTSTRILPDLILSDLHSIRGRMVLVCLQKIMFLFALEVCYKIGHI
jgi:hypothetical protein